MYWKRFLSQFPDFNQATIVTIRSHNQGIRIFSDDKLELCDVAICEQRSATAVSRAENGKKMTA
jgi:predicted ATP-binding protein involved in virulence